MAGYAGAARSFRTLGSSVPPQELESNSGRSETGKPLDEKKRPSNDDDEEEDLDALIEELESHDGDVNVDDEVSDDPSAPRPVPEELLQTDTRTGLTDSEVIARRKKYGLNQMKEEKENLVLKFFSFFVGPIQFVMEVSGLSQ